MAWLLFHLFHKVFGQFGVTVRIPYQSGKEHLHLGKAFFGQLGPGNPHEMRDERYGFAIHLEIKVGLLMNHRPASSVQDGAIAQNHDGSSRDAGERKWSKTAAA